MLFIWMIFNLIVHAEDFNGSAAEVLPVETIYEEALPKDSSTRDFIVLQNGFRFEIIKSSAHELSSELGVLSAEELETFNERRKKILLTMSKFLSYRKMANGLGFIENDKISMIKDGSSPTHPLDSIGEAEGAVPKTNAQKIQNRFKILNRILIATDRFLFENAKNTATNSEFGIDFVFFGGSVNGVRGQVKNHNLIFGRGYGLQIMVGMDFETNQKNFQIKVLKERPRETKAVVINPIGVTVRLGIYLKAKSNLPQSYEVFYPPLLPLYSIKTPGLVSAGYSSAFTPITLLAPLTMGLTAFLESAMTYKAIDSVYTIIDTQTVRLYLGRIKEFISRLKAILIPIHKSNRAYSGSNVISLESRRALKARNTCSLLFAN